MSVGIEAIQGAVKGLFGVIKFGIQTFKSREAITNEVKDLDATEIITLVVTTVTEELPAVVAEVKK